MRALRGYFCPSLLGRKAMASLLAASRKNFPAACGLHARTKPVRLGAASLARLICALWQNNPPSIVQIRCAYRGYRTVAVRSRRNTHGPRLRPTPNHQVYLPFARRVKNGPESPAALARRCLRHECGLFSMRLPLARYDSAPIHSASVAAFSPSPLVALLGWLFHASDIKDLLRPRST
jgi:hypothetical protein